MFCTRFFCATMFAPRFFPKVGATLFFNPAWARNANTIVYGPTSPVTPVGE